MEIDLSQPDARLPPGTMLRAQVCIVGAGIAGLILAHKLAEQGIDLLLLEAGGHLPDTDLPTDLTGEPYPAATEDRIRGFGGTSLLWGGQLLPPPALDAGRSSAPAADTLWSIPAADLAPHFAAAERLFAVDALPYDAPEFFTAAHQPATTLLGQLPGLDARVSKFIPFAHRNLARTLGTALRSHPRIQLLLHAPVRELLLSPEGNRVEAALVTSPDRRMLRLEADHFVLAAGTIESVRLLLLSRSVVPEGVGNTHGQLGRNLHDHLTTSAAVLHSPARESLLREFRPWVFGGTVHSLKLEASAQLRAALGVQPAMAHLTFEEPADSGVAVLRNLLRTRQHLGSRTSFPGMRALPGVAADAVRLALDARLRHRRFVSPRALVRLQINSAQGTPSASRITLSDNHDRLGLPLAAVDFQRPAPDLESIQRFAGHLREVLAPIAPAGLEWLPALSSPDPPALRPHLDDARHPMGGAPISPDPSTGMVDPNLAVHGISNLSVASAATFPDGRAQLPTLLLAALTLRLAHRLAAQLRP